MKLTPLFNRMIIFRADRAEKAPGVTTAHENTNQQLSRLRVAEPKL
jgi:hypothetical protein